jgi:hypothetical protein
MIEYCPNCDGEDLEGGSFGDDVTCHKCKKTWETDWDYTDASGGCTATWITKEINYLTKTL